MAETAPRSSVMAGLQLPEDTEFSVRPAVPTLRRLLLRGDAAVAARAGAALGLVVPERPFGTDAAGDRAVLWLGPGEWLMLTGEGERETVARALDAALDGLPHSLVDVSHRQVGLHVSGRLAARILSSGCPLDLGTRAFPAGTATRTLFHKAEIVLWRREAGFHLEVWRSFAPYVVGHLAAAREAAEGLPDSALP